MTTDGGRTTPEGHFNPPPGWPVPRGWSPPPDWSPDASWPAAPPGWTFWVPGPRNDNREHTDTSVSGLEPEVTPHKRSWHRPAAVIVSIVAAAALVIGGLYAFARRESTAVQTQPHTVTAPESAPEPGWRPPSYQTPLYIDFTSWTGFGGVDADYGENGQSVLLDTHDTTDTWSTKWSGLISPKTVTCSARIVGRVRDVSHTAGVPGGFGIGIATLSGEALDATLTGTAIQFDFGQQGFRTAIYPSDSDHGLEPAALDHNWHDVEVLIDATSHTLTVDGQMVASTPAGGVCGSPMIRVWAGSAEFADFTVTPLD